MELIDAFKKKVALGRIKNMFSPRSEIRVHHGWRSKEVGGPFVKLQRMQAFFPDHPNNFNLIYAVSGCDFPIEVCKRAKRKRIPIVCHFNSCWHPAYADDWEKKNKNLKEIYLNYADFVVFGSEQARRGAKLFVGDRNLPFEIIFNAVDLKHFKPAKEKRGGSFEILAAGYHHFRHRLEPLIRSMPLVLKKIPEAKLTIAGKLGEGDGIYDCGWESIGKIIKWVGCEVVEFISEYSQDQAPGIYQRADILVHLKHMDWTPNVVAEAMACGLPIVHTGNGGVPEIVQDAGVSLEMNENWHELQVVDPAKVAEGIIKAASHQKQLALRAREIAESKFSLEDWAKKHREIFSRLLGL